MIQIRAAWMGCALAMAFGCKSVPEVEPARFENDIRAFEDADRRSPPRSGGTLFVGSSSIRLWDLGASFPGSELINRGFGGSHISDCIAFLPRVVLPYRPQKVVFYAGDNDIAHGKSAERVLADWQRFVAGVHAEMAEARIVFLAIKPSPARWALWPEARRANGLIQGHCVGDARLRFVDVATPMLGPKGLPRPELYVEDKLHLSAAGYKLWSALLADAIAATTSTPRASVAAAPGLRHAAVALGAALLAAAADGPPAALKLGVGSTAPDVTLRDQDGKEVKLSSHRGKQHVLIAFFRQASTGDCKEMLGRLRGEHDRFVKAGVSIVAVSAATVDSHKEIRDSLELPFPLLGDPDARASALYGVATTTPEGERRSARSVFLVDKDGKIRHVDRSYELKTPGDHAALVAAVESLGAGKLASAVGSKQSAAGAAAPFRQPRVTAIAFGAVTVDGIEHENDVILDRGKVRERDKGPSRHLKTRYGHTPLTVKEDIPWSCKRLLIGTGMSGQLPVLDEIKAEAKKRGVELILLKTEEAVKYLEKHGGEDLNVILHITC